ncbi:hypothetical protein Tco_1441989, partial [Tanacetum coccineum]
LLASGSNKVAVQNKNQDEECEIMSTPEKFTQWLDKNVDLVGEGDLFGDNSATLELMNQEITPEKLPTQKASPCPKKRAVKPSSYLLSPYMNKKTNFVPKITRLEFILGNSLFAMQGDKIFRAAESKSRHFFPTGCITKSMFDETLDPDDAKWESFSSQVKAQFEGNDGGLTLKEKVVCSAFEANFHDCGIFTMLHMETFNGGPAANWDCGLPVESQLQRDMLRRLRFKFATKILLHEIIVHAEKMPELAKEFDKIDPVEKIAIIVDALKNREQRDRI